MFNIKKILASFLVLSGLFIFTSQEVSSADSYEVSPVRLYLFHSETCPHCRDEIEFLGKIKDDIPHVEIVAYELSESFKNQSMYARMTDHYGLDGAVPVTVIGDQPIVGFDSEKNVGKKILGLIANASVSPQDSWLDKVLGKKPPSEMEKVQISEKQVKFLGIEDGNVPKVEISNMGSDYVTVFGKDINPAEVSSVFILGVVLGLADGINPCMFSVLIFLLTYLISIGSKRKAIKAGIVFTVTTFALYFLFMFGIIKVVDILGIAHWFRLAVIWFALIFGLIMVKDYFAYGKGISLDIPKVFRPTIKKLIQKGTMASAFVLAIFAGIVELPCTSGLPLAYVTVLSQRELSPVVPLIVYNLFFVIPLFIIILAVYFVWAKTGQMEEARMKMRKYMRLVSGVLLLALALAMWQNWI